MQRFWSGDATAGWRRLILQTNWQNTVKGTRHKAGHINPDAIRSAVSKRAWINTNQICHFERRFMSQTSSCSMTFQWSCKVMYATYRLLMLFWLPIGLCRLSCYCQTRCPIQPPQPKIHCMPGKSGSPPLNYQLRGVLAKGQRPKEWWVAVYSRESNTLSERFHEANGLCKWEEFQFVKEQYLKTGMSSM